MAIAWSPDEQKRLTVVPATLTGRPARRSATRATLLPWAPLGCAQPMITSSISLLSSWGTLPSASLMQWAARSSGRVMLNDPRNDLASGVRELATTTASLIRAPFWVRQVAASIPCLGRLVPFAGARPAVDDDGGAGHERGGFRGEEDAWVGDLVDLAPPAHARAARHRVVGLLGHCGVLFGQHAQVPFGLHRPRRDAVDADAEATPRHSQLAGEVDHGGLGRAVVGHHRRAVDPGDGGEVDDGAPIPLRHHLLARPLAAEEDAVDVDLDHRVPAVGANVLDLGAERRARVVDHDVDAPHLLRGALDQALDGVFLAHVHRLAEGAAPELLDLLHHGLEVLLLAAADHDIGAGLGELHGDGAADTHAASGDDGDLLLERERRRGHDASCARSPSPLRGEGRVRGPKVRGPKVEARVHEPRGLYPSPGRRALEAHGRARTRMNEAQSGRVETEPPKGTGGPAVLAIAHDGMADGRELHADLPPPPRAQRELEQARVVAVTEQLVARNGRLPLRACRGLHAQVPILHETALQRARLASHPSAHQRDVDALHAAGLELGLELTLGRLRLGEDEETRRLAIEAVHDEGPRPLGREIVPEETIGRALALSLGGDAQESWRLVDHHDVRVLMDEAQAAREGDAAARAEHHA